MHFSELRLLLSQPEFLFTNKLSASGIVVLCSDQKFINIIHEKIDIKIHIPVFSQIESKLIENKKKQYLDHTKDFIRCYASLVFWLTVYKSNKIET